jgi:hypothetical protein
VGSEVIGGAAKGPLAHLAGRAAPAGTGGRPPGLNGRTFGYGAGWRGLGKQFTGHSKREKAGERPARPPAGAGARWAW